MRLVLTAVLLCAPGRAFERNEDLLSQCKGNNLGIMGCVSYINGVMEGMLIQAVAADTKPMACIPKGGLSGQQSHAIVVKWLEANPKELHHQRIVGAVLALKEAFPCEAP